MDALYDLVCECYVITDAALPPGEFYGATPAQAHDNYAVALRIAADHTRHNRHWSDRLDGGSNH